MHAPTMTPEIPHPVTSLTEKELYRLGCRRWIEVCEVFCQKLGFDVKEVDGDEINFLLKMKGEETILGYAVCFKSWRHETTEAELSGLEERMRKRGIENGIIFTRGGFSKDALQYVKGKSFDLLTIRVLLKDIKQLKQEAIDEIEALARKIEFLAPCCPGCRKAMVHVKNQVGGFWRCSNYPSCNLTYMN